MAVTPLPKFEYFELSTHVSECPGGNVEYTLRMLYDLWRGELHQKIEGMIRELQLPEADVEALRKSTEILMATWRAATLDAISQIGGGNAGTTGSKASSAS